MRDGECERCGAKVLLVPNDHGRLVPLDVDPVLGGPWLVTDTGKLLRVNDGRYAHRAHFATCPAARPPAQPAQRPAERPAAPRPGNPPPGRGSR